LHFFSALFRANPRLVALQFILAKVFMPLSWIMGVPWDHCEDVGTLIGLKTVINELIAYQKMGEFKKQGRISGRSETIATFAICGFANPGSIGIQLGCMSSLAPEKKEQITKVIVRAFVAGSAVSFLTASVAGKVDILSVQFQHMRLSNIVSISVQYRFQAC
jgi:pyrimidine nucleoside transport protein